MKRLIKWLMILLSTLLLLIGLLTFPLPIPIGLPLFLFGIALLLRYSSDAKRLLVKLSREHPQLRQILNRRRATPFKKATEDKAD